MCSYVYVEIQRLRRSNVLKVINDAMNSKGINLRTIGIPEIRHFLYKSKSNAQLLCSEITVPYNTPEEFNRLEALYYDIHHRIHNSNRPTKLIYQLHEKEIILAWVCFKIREKNVALLLVISIINHVFISRLQRDTSYMQCSSQLSTKALWLL